MVPQSVVNGGGPRENTTLFGPHLSFLKGMVILIAVVALTSGCAKKMVKPSQPTPVPGGIQRGGSVSEQDLRVVQANLKTIYFDYDRFALGSEAQAALQYDAEILKKAPAAKIVAEGHCDERGTDEYNLALGERRARSVVEYLAGLGIPAQLTSTVSYGSELPVDPGHSESAWAKNRRVYLRVIR